MERKRGEERESDAAELHRTQPQGKGGREDGRKGRWKRKGRVKN